MRINEYTGADPIRVQLNNMGANDRVTFTVILSSATQYVEKDANGDVLPLQGILVPADIDGSTMTNNGVEFTTGSFKRYTSAAFVPFNTEFNGEHTYTLQFSFTKADIMNSTHTGDNYVNKPYHDYLLLFLKVGNNAVGQATTLGVNNGVTVRKWYVHY